MFFFLLGPRHHFARRWCCCCGGIDSLPAHSCRALLARSDRPLSLFLANRIKDLKGDLASLFCFYDPSERPRKCRKGSAGQKKNRKKKKRVETFQPSLPYIDAEIGPFVSLLCNSRRPGRNDCIYHLIGLNSICCLIWTRISRFSFLPYLFLCSLCVIACRVQPLRKTTTAHPV